MARPVIVVDSASDIGGEAAKRNIPCEPLRVLLGEREGLDGTEITPEDINAYFAETKKTPKTAAVEPERFARLFEKLTADGSEVIYIAIASTMSGCYNNARIAAENFPGVHVVDSTWLSAGAALLALYADDLANKGYGTQEIIEKVEARRNAVRLSLIVDNMTFLHKGGRCGSMTALIASVLKIKPTIIMENAKLNVGKKYIGLANKALIKYASDTLTKEHNIDPNYFFLIHTSPDREVLDKVRALIEAACPGVNIIENVASATVTSHTGKGGLALIYLGDGGVTD